MNVSDTWYPCPVQVQPELLLHPKSTQARKLIPKETEHTDNGYKTTS